MNLFKEMRVASEFRHIPELDGIRALAVALVMASHAGLEHKSPGGFGVTVFFFLSGYLITSLLRIEFISTGRLDFRAFYLRRVLRIMPPLYITLIILTALCPFQIFGPVNWQAVPWDYLFLSNYSPLWGQTGGLPSPLWSLAIEEHFYLLFPLVFLLILRKHGPSKGAGAFAGICCFIFLLRVATLVFFPNHILDNYLWTHTRLDSILFGSILAMFQNPLIDEGAWVPKKWHVALALLLILSTFSIRSEIFRQTWRYTLQGAALFVLFSFVLHRESKGLSSVLRSKPLVWIGLLSYTLYLCHMAIFEAVRAGLHVRRLYAGILGLPIALLYAQLMRSWVEVPILEWRRRHRRAVNAIVPEPISVSDASDQDQSVPQVLPDVSAFEIRRTGTNSLPN